MRHEPGAGSLELLGGDAPFEIGFLVVQLLGDARDLVLDERAPGASSASEPSAMRIGVTPVAALETAWGAPLLGGPTAGTASAIPILAYDALAAAVGEPLAAWSARSDLTEEEVVATFDRAIAQVRASF